VPKPRLPVGKVGGQKIYSVTVAKAFRERDQLIASLRSEVEARQAELDDARLSYAESRERREKALDDFLAVSNAQTAAFRLALERAMRAPWLRLGLALRLMPRVLYVDPKITIDLNNFRDRQRLYPPKRHPVIRFFRWLENLAVGAE
jgi:hypothetical protein